MKQHLNDLALTWINGIIGVLFFSFAWFTDHLHQIQIVFGMACTGIITISTIIKTWYDVIKSRRVKRGNDSGHE